MCRSIKSLREAETVVTEEDVRAAALQFVRKVSGYRQPSKANQEPFEAAVDEVSESVHKLLDSLVTGRSRAGGLGGGADKAGVASE